MRAKRRQSNILAALGFLAFAACGGTGSCAGCDLEPLPEGELPAGQTIEGAAQARVTSQGFDKISELLPPVFNEFFRDGICVPRQSGELLGVSYEACHQNDCIDADGNPGCQVNINLDSVNTTAPDENTLGIDIQFDADAKIPARYGAAECTFDVEGTDVPLAADIAVDVDERGELSVALDEIQDIDMSSVDISSSNFICNGAAEFINFLKNTIGDFIIRQARPFIDDLIQGFLPDPLGLEGVLDATPYITQFRPQTDVKLEVRGIPGGHANLEKEGLNLGLIAGLNTDVEPEDRSRGNATTPSACVPPVEPPDFSADPYNLPQTERGTFHLPTEGAFVGDADPEGQDVVFGVSETALNLAGYHGFASGALCLGLDSSMVPQLNLGTIGVLVPSLSELGTERGNDPLLVVTRPQEPVEVTVGEGSEESPHLTFHIRDLEIDLYAFLFERWVRGFTLKVDLDLGIGVELVTGEDDQPALLPTLSGLDTENIDIEVLNPEFLREDKSGLEEVIPALFDLVVPRLSKGLGSFALPEFAGFTLTDLQVERIATEEDDFLSIAGAFGASTLLEELAAEYPELRTLETHAAAQPEPPPQRAETRAELVGVDTPAPERVHAAIAGDSDAELPEVVIDVEPRDAQGRPLEWTWRIDGGMWRPFTDATPLVIRDRAFAFQGHYDIEVKARVRGDYRTTDLNPVSIPVIIDSVPPELLLDRAHTGGDRLIVPVSDTVTPEARIERALAAPHAAEPATEYARGDLELSRARELADESGNVRIFARDEAGNESSEAVDLDTLEPASGGCHAAGGGSGAGAGLTVGLALALLALRRRLPLSARALRAGFVAAVGAALVASSACGGTAPGGQCVADEDCAGMCEEGQVPVCSEEGCLCDDDVPLGRAGQYSSLALEADGTRWISAYNSTYGDLVVAHVDENGRVPREAWEFVDGVPEGPVIVENSKIRGGIFETGQDVGLYTDIAISAEGDVLVSYFDKEKGSLKLATRTGDDWEIHVVDEGDVADPEGGYEITGQYSALTLDPDDRPGIAYFVQRSSGGDDTHTELRFAQADTALPQDGSDWDIQVVEEASVATTESEEDPYPIPPGIGLYVAAERYHDGRPVLAYYDRIEGALRWAEMRPSGGGFTEPSVLDDGGGSDVGRFPSLAIDSNGNAHVTYVSASRSELLYLNTAEGDPEVVDDGYRVIGTSDEGEPIPEFHFVGDDSSLLITAAGPVVAYQDATTHELLFAQRGAEGEWERQAVAGNGESFEGGYGFYASSAFDGSSVLISNWVIDQPSSDSWVELHKRVVVE